MHSKDIDEIADHLRHVVICRRIADALRSKLGAQSTSDMATKLGITANVLTHLMSGDPKRSGGTSHLRMNDVFRRAGIARATIDPSWLQEDQIAFFAAVISMDYERGCQDQSLRFILQHPDAVAAIDVIAKYDQYPSRTRLDVPEGIRNKSHLLSHALAGIRSLCANTRNDSLCIQAVRRYCSVPFDCLLPSLLKQVNSESVEDNVKQSAKVLSDLMAHYVQAAEIQAAERCLREHQQRSLQETVLSTPTYTAAFHVLTMSFWKDLMFSLLRSEKFLPSNTN